ncbi:MAG: hypothetical protein PHZ00_01095 [Candidatus Peribacteraceae bacterium]|nr:hypothetical protein [Candidatus Peribacteraceae bacterium]
MDADAYDELDRCLAKIDEEHLRILSMRIGDRLDTLRMRREQEQLQRFRILDRVWFLHEGRSREGTILKINRRTASLRLDDGSQWNVSPHLLHRLEDDFIDATVVEKDDQQPPRDVWKDLLRYLPAGNRKPR